jgi:hypothetical protein
MLWVLFKCSGIKMQTEKVFQRIFPQAGDPHGSGGANHAKGDFPTRNKKYLLVSTGTLVFLTVKLPSVN